MMLCQGVTFMLVLVAWSDAKDVERAATKRELFDDIADKFVDKLVGCLLQSRPSSLDWIDLEHASLGKALSSTALRPVASRRLMPAPPRAWTSMSSGLVARNPRAAITLRPQPFSGFSDNRRFSSGQQRVQPAAAVEDADSGFTQGLAAAAAAFLLVTSSVSVVPSGEVGLLTVFGKVQESALQPGLNLKLPIADSRTFSVKTQLVEEENFVPTKEGLSIELDTALLYHIDPTRVQNLFISVGDDYEAKIIKPELRSIVRGLTSEAEAKTLYTSGRSDLQSRIKEELSENLGRRGIIVEDVLLKAVKLPDQLAKSIELKAQAEQEAQRMEFVLQKEEQEAARKRIQAQGIADFQKIVSNGISPNLLKWKAIEATEKIAESPNTKVIIAGNDGKSLPVILGGD